MSIIKLSVMRTITFFVFLFLLANFSIAQSCDYIVEKYTYRSEKKIFVGIEQDFQNKPDSLFLDIYYPVGSSELKRPLVMWIFGGGFITGSREDFADVCISCAKRGFVAATIDYRIGFNGTSILPFDSAEVIRAGYRGAQDAKSALRYLKSRHVEDSIDLDRVWIGGGSAGAITALAAAYYDKDSEKPMEAGTISAANGNPRNDLGSIEGNRYINGYDTKVQGVLNIFGAVLDLKIIEKKDKIAVFSYHQTEDPVVPCTRKRAYWAYPIVTDFYPIAYGSCEIHPRLNELGLDPNYHKSWIYPGNQHAVHNQAQVVNFLISNANNILCNLVANKNIQKSELENVSAFPVPASNFIQINHQESEFKYQLLNTQGVNVLNGVLSPGASIDIQSIESGSFILRLTKNNQSKNFKVIKI